MGVNHMTWGRLDDKLHENGKVWEAQTASMGLWVLANSWCCDNQQTNGFIPLRVLRRWSDGSINDDVEGVAQLLVDSGLWHKATQGRESGFLFHDWDEYRPESARSSYDARRGNHVRWHANVGVIKADCEFCASDSETPSGTDNDRGDIGATSGGIAPESLPVPVPVPVPNKPCASDDAPDRFDEFWNTYAKKVDRKKSEHRYKLALKKRGVTPDLLIASARSYIEFQKRENKHPQFTKDPATWLNNESWGNELVAAAPPEQRATLPGGSYYTAPPPPDDMPDHLFPDWNRAHALAHRDGRPGPEDWHELAEAS